MSKISTKVARPKPDTLTTRLKIEIKGPSDAGKSTVAQALAAFLRLKGFDVTMIDFPNAEPCHGPFTHPEYFGVIVNDAVQKKERILIECHETEPFES